MSVGMRESRYRATKTFPSSRRSDRCPPLIAHYWHICPDARKREECRSMSTSLFLTITMMVHLFYATPRPTTPFINGGIFLCLQCWNMGVVPKLYSFIRTCFQHRVFWFIFMVIYFFHDVEWRQRFVFTLYKSVFLYRNNKSFKNYHRFSS